jgi:hypothetical protein
LHDRLLRDEISFGSTHNVIIGTPSRLRQVYIDQRRHRQIKEPIQGLVEGGWDLCGEDNVDVFEVGIFLGRVSEPQGLFVKAGREVHEHST